MPAAEREKDPSRPLPSSLYNAASLVGGAIAGVSLGLILFLMVLEALTDEHKPYMGIIAFVVLPLFLLFGLALALLGWWREHRRRGKGLPASMALPSLDLNDARHRRAVFLFSTLTLLLLLLSGFGSYKAYEYTDSDEFCGQVCHRVMKPEYTAYRLSPHARVGCVDCHIGPGAQWFVRSKLSGTRQVYSVLFNKYPRPIPTPIHSLRPSRETCEQCHWPNKFYDQNYEVRDYYLSDEANTHMRLRMLVKIGGGTWESGPTSGIHWHMNIENEVDYIALDGRRQNIPWVRARGRDGVERVFRSTDVELSPAQLDTLDLRRMDCLDCHNRPTHVYHPPARMVNQTLALGWIDRDLPFIKEVAVEALEGDYASTDEAMAGIERAVLGFYRDQYPKLLAVRRADVDRAIAQLEQLYRGSYFPDMGVSWRAFPDNIGHLYSPGCFRCHDGNHVSDDGHVLSRDCNTCHTLLTEETDEWGQVLSLTGIEYRHPEDIGEAWRDTNCSECHGP